MIQEKGSLSIHTENIFPIIKKFLYSDHDIFLRELVANAVDATQKMKKLAQLGESSSELGDLTIHIGVDEEAKTITIEDKGLGLTAEEMKKYINQIAFSGATEFVEKYKDKLDPKDQIIGKFGLGFYSAFMVAEFVDVISLSHQAGAEAAKWSCDGSTSFEISGVEKAERGTKIVLHVSEESKEFLDKSKIKSILEKHCRFMPIPISFDGNVINNPEPLWTKSPSDLTDEDYIAFYKELYPFTEDPLFWIHLNVDYPFNLTGILYFPKIKENVEVQKNKIQLYSRQVFITDEVKDIVPEFLMLMHGVIDSPDIPLNVSRSSLQADGNVKKINNHITKKVADKLHDLYKADRSGYEQKWDSIGVFVKYGILSDEKFYERAKDFVLLKNIENQLFTLEEYKEKTSVNQLDKDNQLVWLYSTEPERQDAYIASAKTRTFDVLNLGGPLDSHFIAAMEQKLEKTSLKRVDSEIMDKLIDKGIAAELILTEDEKTKVKEVFDKAVNNPTMKVELEALASDELPVSVMMPEFMRRMKDMAKSGGMGFGGMFPESYSVVVNGNHPLVQKILKDESEDQKVKLAKQAFDLGLLSQNMLKGPELTAFIKRSVELVG